MHKNGEINLNICTIYKVQWYNYDLQELYNDRGDNVIKKEMIAMLLAGGQGSRLGVSYTAKVAKPAQ